ncbi:hypothetical protein quinque_001897 [Culex quinquefasciatus]
MEKTDKRCAEGRRVVVMTGICGGQFRKSPSQITACRTIFLPCKLYRMRLVRYGEEWHATAIYQAVPHAAGRTRDTVGVEFLAEITSVNGRDFNAVAFLAGLSLRDQLQHPQLPTWREQHELWIKKQRRRLRKQ